MRKNGGRKGVKETTQVNDEYFFTDEGRHN